jgi:hypothetical protein
MKIRGENLPHLTVYQALTFHFLTLSNTSLVGEN